MTASLCEQLLDPFLAGMDQLEVGLPVGVDLVEFDGEVCVAREWCDQGPVVVAVPAVDEHYPVFQFGEKPARFVSWLHHHENGREHEGTLVLGWLDSQSQGAMA